MDFSGTQEYGFYVVQAMKANREQVQKELEKAYQRRGVGSIEQQQILLAMSLQVQLDIRDALDDILQVISGIAVERKDQ